jgi:hypothetical protein
MGADCDYAGFLRTAREMLPEFGAAGAEAVVQALGEELTGLTIPREVTQDPTGYVATFNSVYTGQAGNPLTRDRKPVGPNMGRPQPAPARINRRARDPRLAQQAAMSNEEIVKRTLLVNPEYHEDLLALLEVFARKKLLNADMQRHLKNCASGQKPPEIKPLADRVKAILGLGAASPDASVLELLTALENSGDRNASAKLKQRLDESSPTYSEVKPDLAEIWKRVGSDNRLVAEAAAAQMENAFWRAPTSECLRWLGQGDAQLNKLIWRLVEQRIQRAAAEAPERLAQYRDSALAILQEGEEPLAVRRAALELLLRLKDRQSAPAVVDVLPQLPRELWPAVGRTLRELTGEDFGPREGDGLVEMKVSHERWQRWLKKK